MNDNENKTNAPTINLLPCPFCGGKANIIAEIDEPDETPRFWHVSCDKGCVSTWTTGVKAVSVKTWNTRNEADALRAEVEGYRQLLAEAIYVELDQWAIYNNFPFGKQAGDGRIRLLKKYETNQSFDDRDFDTVLEAYAAIKPNAAGMNCWCYPLPNRTAR